MIPTHIIDAIREGIEQDDIEFKSSLSVKTREDRAKVARSISALANTVSNYGYYIVGVIDKKARKGFTPNDYIVDFSNNSIDDISIEVEKNCIDSFLNLRPNINITIEKYPETDLKILLIIISQPFNRPYFFKRETSGIKEGQAFIRVGASCIEASANDIVKMINPGEGRSTDIFNIIQSMIEDSEAEIYRIQKEIELNRIPSTIKFQYNIAKKDITAEKLHLEDLLDYLKGKTRFSSEIRGIRGNKLIRIYIRRIEELISRFDTTDDTYLNLRKKICDEAISLCFSSLNLDSNQSRIYYNLSRLYDITMESIKEERHLIDTARKAFDSISRSIDIASDFPKARTLRMKVSRLLIDKEDDLYIQDAMEAIEEDERYFGSGEK